MPVFEDDHPIWNHVTTRITELPELVSWCDEGLFISRAEIFFRFNNPFLSPPEFQTNANIILTTSSDIDQVVAVVGGGSWIPFIGNPVFWQQAFTATFESRTPFNFDAQLSKLRRAGTLNGIDTNEGPHLKAMSDGRFAIVWEEIPNTEENGNQAWFQLFDQGYRRIFIGNGYRWSSGHWSHAPYGYFDQSNNRWTATYNPAIWEIDLQPSGGWEVGYRPTKVRVTLDNVGQQYQIVIRDANGNIQTETGWNSGDEIDIDWVTDLDPNYDIAYIRINSLDFGSAFNMIDLEFQTEYQKVQIVDEFLGVTSIKVGAMANGNVITAHSISTGSGSGGTIAIRDPDNPLTPIHTTTFLVGERLQNINAVELPNGNILACYSKRAENTGAFRIFNSDLSSVVVSEVIFFSDQEADILDTTLSVNDSGNWLTLYRNDNVDSYEYLVGDESGNIIKQGVLSTVGFDDSGRGSCALPNGNFVVSHSQGQSTSAGGELWIHYIDGVTGEIINEVDLDGPHVIGTPRWDSIDLVGLKNNHVLGIAEKHLGPFTATGWETYVFELDAAGNIVQSPSIIRSAHGGGPFLYADLLQDSNIVYVTSEFRFFNAENLGTGFVFRLTGNIDRWNMSYPSGAIKPGLKSVDPANDWANETGNFFDKARINFTRKDAQNPLIYSFGNFARVQLQSILQGSCTFNFKQVDGYLSGEEIDLSALAGPNCHINQMSNWYQPATGAYDSEVYWDSIEFFVPPDTWLPITHEDYFTPTLCTWTGTEWSNGGPSSNGFILEPKGNWNVGFSPTKIRVTFTTDAPGFATLDVYDKNSDKIVDGANVTPSYWAITEVDIDWLGADIDRIELNMPGTNIMGIQKIEFLVEDLVRPHWDRKILDETWVLGPDPGVTEYGSWDHAGLFWSSENVFPAHLLNVYAREGYAGFDWNTDYRPKKVRFTYTGTIHEIWVRDKDFGIMFYSDATPPVSGQIYDCVDLGFDLQQVHFSSTAGPFTVSKIEFLI